MPTRELCRKYDKIAQWWMNPVGRIFVNSRWCSWHPVVVLNAISGILFVVYFVVAIAILHIPSYRYPYVISIGGAALMCWLAVRCSSESDRASIIVSYALTTMNVFTSCGCILVVISYLTGENSGLWHMMH
jgi:hypothetical protein